MSGQYLRDKAYDFLELSEDTREKVDLTLDIATLGFGAYKGVKTLLKEGKKLADD